jgi:hypothetical protein
MLPWGWYQVVEKQYFLSAFNIGVCQRKLKYSRMYEHGSRDGPELVVSRKKEKQFYRLKKFSWETGKYNIFYYGIQSSRKSSIFIRIQYWCMPKGNKKF